MEPHHMGRIDAAFENLKIVALLIEQPVVAIAVRDAQKLKIRQHRQRLRRTHVDPDNSAPLHAWISGVMNLVGELLLHGNVGHLHALPIGSKLPTVIWTAQTIALDPAEKQWRQPMRAKGTDHADPAVERAKQHQVLAE